MVLLLLPFYRIDAHSHRQGLIQRVFAAETQTDAPLAADKTSMRIHNTLDGVLIHEMCSVALKLKKQNITN